MGTVAANGRGDMTEVMVLWSRYEW